MLIRYGLIQRNLVFSAISPEDIRQRFESISSQAEDNIPNARVAERNAVR
ncbi:MAG: hypothetical protein ACTSU2_15595 [Promethearchaeota archaeon]